MNIHEKYINRCLELARNGLGMVSPNPMVGCVIVNDDKIIGEGYHIKCGDSHAEVNAINSVKDKALLGTSTLYVNLEPCSHHGKTPPCADLIIEHKIPEVVVGCKDKCSLVDGKGINKLRDAGCNVITGVLEDECNELNKRFFVYQEKRRPYIILKWAQTIDGFIDKIRNNQTEAKPNWISGEAARILAHKWRTEEDAIMIGTNTALIDNPQLTARDFHGKNPLRIFLDKNLTLPENLHLFDKTIPTLIFTSLKHKSENNLEYVAIDFEHDIIPQVLQVLYEREIQSVIIEGGSKLLNSFIQADLWDEARVIIGNKTFGNGLKAPILNAEPLLIDEIGKDKLLFYRNYPVK